MNGKILAPRRAYAYNLLDNSDFTNPVNQRVQTSYTGGYTIDRWVLYGTDNLTINHGYITVSGDLYQYIPADVIPDGMYTVCACKRDGTIVSFNRLSTAVVDWYNGLAFGLDSSGEKIAVGLRSGEYVWAALYEGSYTAETLPPYVPRGYAAELAECAWYFRIFESYSAAPCGYAGYTHSATVARFLLPLGLPMRADSIPVISVNNLSTWRIMCNGSTYVPTRIISVGISKSGAGMTQFSLEIESSGMPANHAATLKIMSSFSVSNEL